MTHDGGRLRISQLQSVVVNSPVRLLYNDDGGQSVMRLNHLKEAGAYPKVSAADRYRAHPEHMPAVIETLTRRLLRIKGRVIIRGPAHSESASASLTGIWSCTSKGWQPLTFRTVSI